MFSFLAQALAIVVFLASSLGVVVVLQYFARRFIQEEDDDEHARKNLKVTRGQPLGRLKVARRDLERVALPEHIEPRTLFLGGLWLPRSQETTHTLAIGVTGSGKSIIAKIQMANALGRIVSPLGNERVGAVVYDNKRELLPTIAAVVGPERLLILNPFHAEGISPDLACMFDTEARIHQLAGACIEQRPGDAQPFWAQSGQDVLTAVAMVFQEKAPGRWTFRDLIEAASSLARLRLVLRQSEQTRSLIDTYLEVEVTAKNILASIRAHMRDFRPVAAAWHATPRTLNLKTFVTELGGVLVLQPSEEKRRASRATQKLFFELLLQYALDLDDSEERRLFFFLDEVQELGRIDLLPRALAVGRSKGLAFFIYTQTLAGLLKAYGEHDTEQIVANCGNQALFTLRGKTATWGAEQFGQIEIKRDVKSQSESAGGTSNSTSEQYQLQHTMFGSEFTAIKPPSRERGLTGVYQTRLTRPFTSTLTGLDRLLPKSRPDVDVAAFVPRPDSEEVLKPWTLDDLYRLGLHLTDDDDPGAILGVTEPPPSPPPAKAAEVSVATPSEPAEEGDRIFGKLRGLLGRGPHPLPQTPERRPS